MNPEAKRSFSVRRLGKGRYEVRIVQPDFIGLLSVLTGLFASNGIGIENGKIETLKKTAKDVFRVQSRTLPDWKQLESDLN